MENKNEKLSVNDIGGQAVIEGVMMRGRETYSVAVRTPEGSITIVKNKITSKVGRSKIFKLPILRGVIAFIDSLIIGTKTITASAELAGMSIDEGDSGELSKFEKFITDKLGDKLNDVIIGISVVFSIVLAIGLFMLLPVLVSSIFKNFVWERALGVLEGVIRLLIFLIYIILISKLKDIKRVFEYHGAEHKTINCFEDNKDLTVENVKQYSRFHKRCGTSFLILVMLISMLIFMFVNTNNVGIRIASRVLLFPVVAGLSYEVIKWAGKSKSLFVKIVSCPGIALQRITTVEPDDSQIETAIAALNSVLDDEFTEKESENA